MDNQADTVKPGSLTNGQDLGLDQDLNLEMDVIRNLITVSHKAKKNSYSPYSGYAVGAALLTIDNKIFTGCNVENSSYGLGICAERTALTKAVSEGFRIFKAIAIAGDDEARFISPCGACRQFMSEFGLDYEIYMTKPDLSYKRVLVRELLPEAFVPSCLE